MLKRINNIEKSCACIPISHAAFPSPFKTGLEYSPPARGTWNIVHIGMLIPESHQIFVCAENCLRGVILTAAEMNACERFSTVTIEEHNCLDGDMENLIIDRVSDILDRLPNRPKAVLVFTSCIHHFMGCDLEMCYRVLRKKYPGTDFTDCYMNPIMRKSGLTPDQIMRKQLYSLIRASESHDKSVNIIGNNIPTDETSDLVRLINRSEYLLRDITFCKSYSDYQDMAKSSLNICYNPPAIPAGEELKTRLGQKFIYIPLMYTADEIRQNMTLLSMALNTEYDGDYEAEAAAEKALEKAKAVIKNSPVAIDYTATMRPLNLARMLTEHGFNVTKIFADSFSNEEKEDYEILKKLNPKLEIFPSSAPVMRVIPRESSEKTLAIGQKAAYFTGSEYFVNIVEGGGMYGFDGIAKLAEMMTDAFENPKETIKYIQPKGLGCACAL